MVECSEWLATAPGAHEGGTGEDSEVFVLLRISSSSLQPGNQLGLGQVSWLGAQHITQGAVATAASLPAAMVQGAQEASSWGEGCSDISSPGPADGAQWLQGASRGSLLM